jgi:hypothetical protein
LPGTAAIARKIGVGQILPPALRDGPKPDIHLVQSVSLRGNQLEQVAVDEAVEISRELNSGLFAKTGKTIDTMAGSNLDAVP